MKCFLFLLLITFSINLFTDDKEEDKSWDFIIDSTVHEGNQNSINKSNDLKKNKNGDKEKKKKKEEGVMDFSNINLESDDLDREEDKAEEKEIDEEIIKSEKYKSKIELNVDKIKNSRKVKEDKLFLSFFSLQTEFNYKNLMLFKNIPYNYSFSFEISTSILGLELKDFNVYLGEIGYGLTYGNTKIQEVIISPLKAEFNFRRWGYVFPLKINLFKIYFFDKVVIANSNKEINLFFEYISLNISWRYFKNNNISSNIFLGFSFGPDDINSNPKRESLVFTIGISGEISPIKIKF